MDETEAGSGAEQPAPHEARKDFFISYTHADQKWARWIAWCLEQGGYSIIYDEWDFPAGSNFIYEMDQALKRAERLVGVLSPAYLHSKFGFSEWAAQFRRDPDGAKRLLVPVLIEACDDDEGLLGSIVHINLVSLPEQEARELLLAGVQRNRPHPRSVPYPGPKPPALIAERPAFPGALPPLWNIPYQRNPLFTGREELLARLESALQAGQMAALSQPQAISGLGGVGKTQIAIEYAYRHRQDYTAIFWVSAQSQETLIAGFSEIARQLNLPQKDEKDQSIIIQPSSAGCASTINGCSSSTMPTTWTSLASTCHQRRPAATFYSPRGHRRWGGWRKRSKWGRWTSSRERSFCCAARTFLPPMRHWSKRRQSSRRRRGRWCANLADFPWRSTRPEHILKKRTAVSPTIAASTRRSAKRYINGAAARSTIILSR